MRPLLTALDRIASALESVAITGFTAIALTLGAMQVLLRYVFNTGIPSSEALFVLATAAGMMFAGSRAVREDKHVRFELLPMLLPARPIAALRLLAHGVSFALCAYFAWCGLQYVLFVDEMDVVSPETGLPDALTYALVPAAMGLFALRYAIQIARTLRGDPEPHTDPRLTDPVPLEGRS